MTGKYIGQLVNRTPDTRMRVVCSLDMYTRAQENLKIFFEFRREKKNYSNFEIKYC